MKRYEVYNTSRTYLKNKNQGHGPISHKKFLRRTLDNELYTSNGDKNDVVDNESIEHGIEMF